MNTTSAIRAHRLIVIYRGLSPAECLAQSTALYAAGVRLFEVTLNSDQPFTTIRLLRKEFGPEASIGAGTVLHPAEVEQVAEAGADFVISPNLDERVVAATRRAGLVSIPGAFTPTEIAWAADAGADFVKVFPIRPVGADYITQIRAPLPHIPLIATGGVDAALASAVIEAGCVGVGVGSHLLAPQPDDRARLVAGARAMLTAVGQEQE
jgi:2-dehydro-3-deoxyphosphogluconate aldolase / (4S)-4-hydroxy-2-oxoglutarate aldolase